MGQLIPAVNLEVIFCYINNSVERVGNIMWVKCMWKKISCYICNITWVFTYITQHCHRYICNSHACANIAWSPSAFECLCMAYGILPFMLHIFQNIDRMWLTCVLIVHASFNKLTALVSLYLCGVLNCIYLLHM